MITLTIKDGLVTEYEKHALSIGQILVLAAVRTFKTHKRVAQFLRRDEKEIGMVMVRIRAKGILP